MPWRTNDSSKVGYAGKLNEYLKTQAGICSAPQYPMQESLVFNIVQKSENPLSQCIFLMYSHDLKFCLFNGILVNGDNFLVNKTWLFLLWVVYKEKKQSRLLHDNFILKVHHHTREVTKHL